MTKHADGPRFRITLPSINPSITLAGSSVAEVARSLEFRARAITQLRMATEEAAHNVIHHAYPDQPDQSFEVECEKIPLGIRVSIRDQGLPFDPAVDCQFGQKGWDRMGALVDRLAYRNLGRQGKEIVLIRFRHESNLASHFSAAELAPYQDQPKAPETDCVIRETRPEEALGVCRAIYKTYGYTYDHDVVYFPERFAEAIRKGLIISAVAVTAQGEVVGHAGVSLEGPTSTTANLGMLAVEPRFRGHNLAMRLGQFLLKKAREAGLAGVFSLAVTSHPFSQKLMHKNGFQDCAVLMGYAPAISFHGIDESQIQRETLLLGYLSFEDLSDIAVYTPESHKSAIAQILEPLCRECHLQTDPKDFNLRPKSECTVTVAPERSQAIIDIQNPGEDAIELITRQLHTLKLRRIEFILLKLNLRSPALPRLVQQVESLGFFFAGILPQWRGDGAFLMNFLNNVPIDCQSLKLDGDRATKLSKYVQAEMRKAYTYPALA